MIGPLAHFLVADAVRIGGNGRTVDLRLVSTLADSTGASLALTVAEPAAAGAETLTLTAPRLVGRVPAGAWLELVETSAQIEAAVAATPAKNRITVVLAAPLAAAVAAGAIVVPVSRSAPGVFASELAEREERLAEGPVLQRRRRWRVAALECPFVPAAGQCTFIEVDGRSEPVAEVEPMTTGATVTGWILSTGGSQ